MVLVTRKKEEHVMPKYVLLSTLTTEGRQTMHAHPERLEAVNKEIEELGCHVVS